MPLPHDADGAGRPDRSPRPERWVSWHLTTPVRTDRALLALCTLMPELARLLALARVVRGVYCTRGALLEEGRVYFG